MKTIHCVIAFFLAGIILTHLVVPGSAEEHMSPPGYRAIFNGKDLTGWYGLNPRNGANLKGEQLEANRKQQRLDFPKHWHNENGEMLSDGTGSYATTDPNDSAMAEARIILVKPQQANGSWGMASRPGGKGAKNLAPIIHVGTAQARWMLLVANYASGSVASLPAKADGSLGEHASFIAHKGSSVNPLRQKELRVHSIVASPDNKHAFVVDLRSAHNLVDAVCSSTGSLASAAALRMPARSPSCRQ